MDYHLDEEQSGHGNLCSPFSLPRGFRFDPSDHEIIACYLAPKVANQPMPPIVIEANIYQYDPMKLAEIHNPQGEGKWYFFSPRERLYKNGVRPNRAAGEGYWKPYGAEEKVTNDGVTIGYKMKLGYYKGNRSNREKTNWLMHEYKLHKAPQRRRSRPEDMRLDDIVLCKIYEKKYKSFAKRRKSSSSKEGDDEKEDKTQNINNTSSPLIEDSKDIQASTMSSQPLDVAGFVGSYVAFPTCEENPYDGVKQLNVNHQGVSSPPDFDLFTNSVDVGNYDALHAGFQNIKSEKNEIDSYKVGLRKHSEEACIATGCPRTSS